ncbi:probable amino acid transporter, APC superfamily protein (plasmid) [Rhodococcus jostii RHA1]|uniref:Probable amino acid transporter, APC superfamily protein n=1 Tax=Rhodococcus jostii (strain RHA1) TaxID=101510 RepID=Q0RYF6_RHOJR|nr:APC family permease [Rhodococcus jostii]ABG99680.1 probable amino acid transporter, APC superfamily protein [Rhodococcus jostii RHA1]
MSSAKEPRTTIPPQHDTDEAGSMLRTLTWRDGFVFALNMPIGLFLTLGYTVGAIGGWTAIAIWGVACALAFLQNNLFAEMAAMFPNRSGGISVYAYEGWKRHFAPLGAIAAFGYWMGWSLSLSVEGVVLGTLIEQAFFPDSHIALQLPIGHELGLPYLIAIGAIFTAWALNYFGVKLAAGAAKVTGILLVIGLLVLTVGPFVASGSDFDISRISWTGASSPFGWKEVVVWFYITAWTTYGTEVCASFAAEYKNPVRDTARALRISAAFILGLYIVVPYVVVGALGEETIGLNPVNYIGLAFDRILGGYSWLGQLPVMAAFIIAMMTATADGGRSLYGISRSGGTIKQLGVLNKYGVPGRALTTDMLINITVLIVLGEPIAILLASNLGYLTAVTLAVGAFVLLRRDQPHLHRPLKLPHYWVPIACLLFAVNAFAIVIGISNPSLTGYGGISETIAGVGILLFACVLWYYRQRVQERQRIEWRVKDEPPPAVHGPAHRNPQPQNRKP